MSVVTIDCGNLGYYPNVTVELRHVHELVTGDAVYSPSSACHGIVIQDLDEGDRVIIKWFKWDPRIEMPMMENMWRGDAPVLVISDYRIATRLDLTNYEKGGPYN